MAEEPKTEGGKRPTAARRPRAGKEAAQTKTAAPGRATRRRTPREQAKAAPSTETGPAAPAETASAPPRESKTAEEANRAQWVRKLKNVSRELGAESQRNILKGLDAVAASEATEELIGALAEGGAKDVQAGAKVLAASENITVQSQVVGSLAAEDLELGMALAGVAGQLGAVGEVVAGPGALVIADFLETKSSELHRLAVEEILRAGATRALARRLAETGRDVAEAGAEELTEGRLRLAFSEEAAEQSEELAGEGLGLVEMGLIEEAEAEEAREAAMQAQETEPAEGDQGATKSSPELVTKP